jgi:hypothetical protein
MTDYRAVKAVKKNLPTPEYICGLSCLRTLCDVVPPTDAQVHLLRGITDTVSQVVPSLQCGVFAPVVNLRKDVDPVR